jgi:hypothetical protein
LLFLAFYDKTFLSFYFDRSLTTYILARGVSVRLATWIKQWQLLMWLVFILFIGTLTFLLGTKRIGAFSYDSSEWRPVTRTQAAGNNSPEPASLGERQHRPPVQSSSNLPVTKPSVTINRIPANFGYYKIVPLTPQELERHRIQEQRRSEDVQFFTIVFTLCITELFFGAPETAIEADDGAVDIAALATVGGAAEEGFGLFTKNLTIEEEGGLFGRRVKYSVSNGLISRAGRVVGSGRPFLRMTEDGRFFTWNGLSGDGQVIARLGERGGIYQVAPFGNKRIGAVGSKGTIFDIKNRAVLKIVRR